MTRRRVSLGLAWLLTLAGAGCAHPSRAVEVGRSTAQASSAEELFVEGVSYAMRGDTLCAEQYLRAAQRREYEPAVVAFWLVRVCVASSRFEAALGHAERYLRGNPNDAWFRYLAANIHDALGHHQTARRELERVVEARPESALAHYRLGVLYSEALGDPSAAARHFREYLRIDPHGTHAVEAWDSLIPKHGPTGRVVAQPGDDL